MIDLNYFSNIQEVYNNPDVVAIAFTLIVLIFSYTLLLGVLRLKTKNSKTNPKPFVFVISLVISLLFLNSFYTIKNWFIALNISIMVAYLAVFLFLILIFLKYIKRVIFH